jgi:hypothetical protein
MTLYLIWMIGYGVATIYDVSISPYPIVETLYLNALTVNDPIADFILIIPRWKLTALKQLVLFFCWWTLPFRIILDYFVF